MNNKNYVAAGVFVIVIALGAGIAYYFDPGAISNMVGVDSAEISVASDTDILPLDDGSSTFSAFDAAQTGADSAVATDAGAAPAPSIKKSSQKAAQKKNETVGSIAATPVAVPQSQDVGPPFAQNTDEGTNNSSSDQVTEDSSPSLPPVSARLCSFPGSAPSPTRKIILNEIAWMGSPSSSNAEWVEIKNNSADNVGLSGWELFDASGKIKISFSDGDALSPGGFMILSRGSTPAVVVGSAAPVKIYSGDLANAGDTLALVDAQCTAADYLDASNGWPGGNNTTKATLERDADGIGWHTSTSPGGTPGAENSAGPPPAQFKVSVALSGSAVGTRITSDPAGLVCGTSCTGSFASGTRITLTPVAGLNAAFIGWSGLCYDQPTCAFTVAASTSLTAQFVSMLAPPASAAAANTTGADTGVEISSISTGVVTSSSPAESGTGQGDITSGSAGAGTAVASTGHVLIAAVQIAGASSSNDFVKLYNPTGMAIDMSGWKLHKKSQTGSDYSLKAFPAGSTIAAGQSFVWANSAGGFSETIDANVSSTETLSADNSVALMDPTGNIIDAVAWGTGSGQYGEGPPYPTDPAAGQTVARAMSNGVMADTDNNASDFMLH